MCTESQVIDEVSYYEYVGAIMDAERRDKLRRALGPANKASRLCILTAAFFLPMCILFMNNLCYNACLLTKLTFASFPEFENNE